jgi:hypothetical protein
LHDFGKVGMMRIWRLGESWGNVGKLGENFSRIILEISIFMWAYTVEK